MLQLQQPEEFAPTKTTASSHSWGTWSEKGRHLLIALLIQEEDEMISMKEQAHLLFLIHWSEELSDIESVSCEPLTHFLVSLILAAIRYLFFVNKELTETITLTTYNWLERS